ncbi:hypothetical protein ES695_14570 [Candidatus Atribacteria bacterium 1244-E10-H5-B2]|nr:MAG: hypothetical protein ES695_14570 [Candidatus Atribacteria bacterium 1244-E10-H5-B2]
MEKEVVDYDFQSQLLEERKNKIEGGLKVMKFNEEHHLGNRLAWTVDLFYELDQYILSLNKDIRKEYLQSYIKYSFRGLLFCYIATQKVENLRVWAKIAYGKLGDKIPLFVRNYEPVSRRLGVLVSFDNKREFFENKEAMLETTFDIIRRAFQGIEDRRERKKTPLLKKLKEVEQIEKKIEITEPSSINISVDDNGYLSINLKIHKSKKILLDKILEETILK